VRYEQGFKSYEPAHVMHQSMVADGFVLYSKQVVTGRLWRVAGTGCVTLQLRQVLGSNPTENGANFGELFLRWLD